MKKEIIQRIIAVINTLNTVEVRGRANYDAMSGSLRVLEETAQMLTELQDSKGQEVN